MDNLSLLQGLRQGRDTLLDLSDLGEGQRRTSGGGERINSRGRKEDQFWREERGSILEGGERINSGGRREDQFWREKRGSILEGEERINSGGRQEALFRRQKDFQRKKEAPDLLYEHDMGQVQAGLVPGKTLAHGQASLDIANVTYVWTQMS